MRPYAPKSAILGQYTECKINVLYSVESKMDYYNWNKMSNFTHLFIYYTFDAGGLTHPV